jgi:hypothetical protein
VANHCLSWAKVFFFNETGGQDFYIVLLFNRSDIFILCYHSVLASYRIYADPESFSATPNLGGTNSQMFRLLAAA